jgi:hypothetical protein
MIVLSLTIAAITISQSTPKDSTLRKISVAHLYRYANRSTSSGEYVAFRGEFICRIDAPGRYHATLLFEYLPLKDRSILTLLSLPGHGDKKQLSPMLLFEPGELGRSRVPPPSTRPSARRRRRGTHRSRCGRGWPENVLYYNQ